MSWNHLEQARTSWNHLEQGRTNQNKLELDGDTKDQNQKEFGQLVEMAVVSCYLMHQKENLRQTYNNANMQSFVEYIILSEQHELEINSTFIISIQ